MKLALLAALVAALLIGVANAYPGIEPWQDTTITPFKERTMMVYQAPDGLRIKLITVPTRPNRLAYVCFKIKDQVLLQCLYIDRRDQSIDVTPIRPLESDV